MKIAFLIDKFPVLSETFILNQITGLIDRGHEIDIYASAFGDIRKVHPEVASYRLLDRTRSMPLIPRNRVLRVLKGVCLGAFYFWEAPCIMLRSINVFRYGKNAASLKLLYETIPHLGCRSYDIIQCHFGPNGVRGVLLRDIGAIQGKVVTMFHGYDFRIGLGEKNRRYAPLVEKGDCILSTSDYSRKQLEKFGFSSQKIVGHTVGIHMNQFPLRRVQDDLTKNERIAEIITVARLEKEKGIEYGIRSIYELFKKNPKIRAHYTIVGGGKLEHSLRNLVHSLGIDDSVSFLGPCDKIEVIRHLNKSDIFLFPSINEILGVALMEAQAVGLPAIVTGVGGVPEVIRDGVSGFVVPAQDPVALAEKLACLITDKQMMLRMGQAGRVHIEEHYNIDTLNDRLEKIYQRLLPERLH